nr:MAG TPA: hypothetical protein [Caudoviricetes sp.]
MATIAELKQEFVNYIATLDKSEMSLTDLRYYAELIRCADQLFESRRAKVTPDPDMMNRCCTAFVQ